MYIYRPALTDEFTTLIQALLALKSHYEFYIMVFFRRIGSSCPYSLFMLKNKGVMQGKNIKHISSVVIIFKEFCLCLTSSKLLWNVSL